MQRIGLTATQTTAMSSDDLEALGFRKLPIKDVVRGALYDEKGFAYLLFVRSRPTASLNRVRAMAQGTDGRVFRVKKVEKKGLAMFRKLVFTFESADGAVFQFAPKGAWDADDGSVESFCAAVIMERHLPTEMIDYMPGDYWQPFDKEMIAELLENIRVLRK